MKFKVWLKDPIKNFLLEYYKRSIIKCSDKVTISELAIALSTEDIMPLRMIMRKINKRYETKTD